ncbi:hypothetical protein [Paenibacillus sp. UNC451MF]|uniref:hypothetical protein n=1 Tax=Paenibacillus sp. UNC451MF TaxID=1449063 RepID=UPI00049056A9|nr:hypothetical protein [Paenibacillus sp. UNC451MF]
MNAYVVAEDRRLLEELRLSSDYGSISSISREMIAVLLMEAEEGESSSSHVGFTGSASQELGRSGLESASDVWIVSGECLDIYEVIALRATCRAHTFIYLLSNEPDFIGLKTTQSLCAAHGIRYVMPNLTPEQAAREVGRLCFAKEQPVSKVITAMGALPQLGLTSSLLLTGLQLSKLSGKRIGILGLNGWNPGDNGLKYEAKYLDELWGSLQGRQLQGGDLLGKMQEIAPGVHYLAGNRDLKKLYYYHTDGISWLIDKARESFDLVLIDAGSYPDHALSAQSIYAADLLLVQMNQSQAAKEQWRRMCEHILYPVFHLENRQAMLLFNRMLRSPDMENEKQLSRQLNMPYVGSLPQVASFYRSEAEKSLLSQYWPEYDKELRKVCRAILHYYSIPLLPASDRVASSVAAKSEKSSWLRWVKPLKEA